MGFLEEENVNGEVAEKAEEKVAAIEIRERTDVSRGDSY